VSCTNITESSSHSLVVQQLSQNIFNESYDPIVIIDFTNNQIGNYLAVNEAYCRQTGFTKEEMLHKKPTDLFLPEFETRVPTLIKQMLQEKQLKIEVPRVIKDGQRVRSEITAQLFDFGEKQVILTYIRDLHTVESNLYYKELFHHAVDGIAMVEIKGDRMERYLDANQAYCDALEYTREEILQSTPYDILPTVVTDYFPKLIKELRTVKHQKFEIERISRYGKKSHSEIIGSLLHIKGKDVLLVIFRDITERKKSEEYETYYKQIFDHALDGLVLLELNGDRLGNYLAVNPAYCDITGYTRDELLQLSPYDLFPDFSLSTFPDRIKEIKVSDKQHFEAESLTKSGKMFMSEISAHLFNIEGQDFILSTIRDITERKKLELEGERYRTLVKNIPAVTVITDTDGQTTFISSNVKEVIGYTPEEIYVGGDDLWFGRVHPEDLANITSAWVDYMADKQSFDIEYRYKHKNGEYIWLHEYGLLVFEEGEKKLSYGFFIDTTLEKHMIRELQLSQTQREKFEAMVSHELRTPLTAILGNAEILEKYSNKLPVESCATTIIRNVKRLEKIVDTIIDVTDIEHGLFNVKLEKVDIIDFMRKMVEIYKHVGIKFFLCKPQPPVFINLDQKKMHIVINNILKNALKHTKTEDRIITVTCQTFQQIMQIIINDNGIGIVKKNLQRIFDKFVSIPTEITIERAGIGLYVANQILIAHGGTITAISRGKWKGSSFIIELPIPKNPK